MGAPLYYHHPASLEHDPRLLSPGHPDTPERLIVLEAALERRGWLGWERRLAPAASEGQLELVHSPQLVRAIRELCEAGGGAIDPDTYVGPRSYEAALHAAGGACELARALLAGETPVGFAGLRPSGHHAERDRAMGFCLFDSVAVAAAWAIAEWGLERVFVLDWDVHHGNGTAEIFRTRRDVLFASLHQSPLYPGTGPLQDAGSGTGEGYTINLPVPPGTGPGLWMALIDEIVLPVARAFEPQLILVSSGFDAHRLDPLAHCLLETSTFVAMAERLRDLGCELGAPVGVVLEGGYDANVLAECVCEMLPALAVSGERGQADEAVTSTDPLLALAREQFARWWPLG
ncbi:MAG TPA: histone deacetylase [Solirubrobacteraceae bacterium]|jgi:acetoin utilization deacetylase AcuC-like enzyme|nr:histone deacetylase [Solirubrobacteraceae bacterium]